MRNVKKIIKLTELPFRLTVKFGDNNGYKVFNVIIHAIGPDLVTRVTVLNIDFIGRSYTLYREYMTNIIITRIHEFLKTKRYVVNLSNNTEIYELTSDEINISNQSLHPVNSQPSPKPVLGECSICLDELNSSNIKNPIMKLPCGHIFHLKCIQQHRNLKQAPHTFFNCPLCRKKINLSNFNKEVKEVKEVQKVKKVLKLLEKYPTVNSNKAKNLLNYEPEYIKAVLNAKGLSFNQDKFNESLITMLQIHPNINIRDIHQLRQRTIESLILSKKGDKVSKLLEKYPSVNANKAKKILNYEPEYIKAVLNANGVSFNQDKFNERLITMLQIYPNINIRDIHQLRQRTIESLIARKQVQNRLQREGTPI